MTISSQLKKTLANLKGIESTLSVYYLQSQEDDERAAYSEAMEAAGSVINDLESGIRKLEFEEPQYKGF